MFNYNAEAVKAILKNIIQATIAPEVFNWLEEERALNTSFMLLPRKTGKGIINITQEQSEQLAAIIPGFFVGDWSIDRVGRVFVEVRFCNGVPGGGRELYCHLFCDAFVFACGAGVHGYEQAY